MLPVVLLTALAMLAFAGNSLLCRMALKNTGIDAVSFTLVRIVSGALVLWLIVRLRKGSPAAAGSWRSAAALFVYAEAFSFAYVGLSAATGALLLFGAVQVTMVGHGLARGERLSVRQGIGIVLAFGGLIALLLPGLAAPPPERALLMALAGIAWAIYSLRAKGAGDPTTVTAGNFLRAVPLAAVLSLAMLPWASVDLPGFGYALASGALTSGLGYVIWYSALRGLRAASAATVQLSVPAIAAMGGVVLLDEPMTWRLLASSAAILGGVALVVAVRRRAG
ncbi:MAG: DMT family transporter [Variovorax sp.]|nr:MAG: DMT family transporter [Variovorax sp.]